MSHSSSEACKTLQCDFGWKAAVNQLQLRASSPELLALCKVTVLTVPVLVLVLTCLTCGSSLSKCLTPYAKWYIGVCKAIVGIMLPSGYRSCDFTPTMKRKKRLACMTASNFLN